MQLTMNSNGFFFFGNGRFINPGNLPKDYIVKGFKLVQKYVQIMKIESGFCLKLVELNPYPTLRNVNNKKEMNYWRYTNKYEVGSFYYPYPSSLNNKPLQVLDLDKELAVMFLSKDTLFVNKQNKTIEELILNKNLLNSKIELHYSGIPIIPKFQKVIKLDKIRIAS